MVKGQVHVDSARAIKQRRVMCRAERRPTQAACCLEGLPAVRLLTQTPSQNPVSALLRAGTFTHSTTFRGLRPGLPAAGMAQHQLGLLVSAPRPGFPAQSCHLSMRWSGGRPRLLKCEGPLHRLHVSSLGQPPDQCMLKWQF